MFLKVENKIVLFISLAFSYRIIICEKNVPLRLSCMSDDTLLRYKHFEINFYFSSRTQNHQLLTSKSIASGEIDIDPTRRIVVIVHGLQPGPYLNLMYNLRDAFLKWDDVNVIYVDWEKGCNSRRYYDQASRNTEYAAIKIKNLFKTFIQTWNGTKKSVERWGPLHFIGLSLGAHVVGQAAELLKEANEPFVHRVTGLDPAEPCLNNADSPLRLNKSNAHFVDVIHTDGARSLNSRLGLLDPMGDVDFYVNGGSFQPGCSLRRKKRTIDYLRLGYHIFLQNGRCHHLRSIILFTESLEQTILKQCKFWAQPWDLQEMYSERPYYNEDQSDETKCIEMGINAELYNNTTNIYYAATSGSSAYCKD